MTLLMQGPLAPCDTSNGRLTLGAKYCKYLVSLLAAALLMGHGASIYAQGHAQGGPIQVLSSSAASEFPDGIRFKLSASAEQDITSVAIRFRVGQQTRGAYDYLEFSKGRRVESELFWRTNTAARYIPPGTIITYNFEVEDSAGARLDTKSEEFIYHDARFQWSEVSRGPLAVAYHGPVKQRAELILDVMIKTLEKMGPLLGADTSIPIRVTMYNNIKEMLEALPPGSTTIRRELITEGQAFSDVGMLLVLGGGSLAGGTASHELTHILVHRAGDSVLRGVPVWLNEGLAEYGNIDPGFSYDIALNFAVATDRLLPITSMRAMPADPEDVIIFYGEASSIVRFMVDTFGAERLRQLLAALKTGKSVEAALTEVYSIDSVTLENMWRKELGATPYTPPQPGRARPTPLPRPSLLPYSLTPQPKSAAAAEPDEALTPEPTAPFVPAPRPTPSEAPAQLAPTPEPTPAQAAGGACSGPASGAGAILDLASLATAAGLVALCLRRRRRG